MVFICSFTKLRIIKLMLNSDDDDDNNNNNNNNNNYSQTYLHLLICE